MSCWFQLKLDSPTVNNGFHPIKYVANSAKLAVENCTVIFSNLTDEVKWSDLNTSLENTKCVPPLLFEQIMQKRLVQIIIQTIYILSEQMTI